MYKSFYGMEYNPFEKSNHNRVGETYKTIDFNHMLARLEHLKKLGGIGLFTGLSGTEYVKYTDM